MSNPRRSIIREHYWIYSRVIMLDGSLRWFEAKRMIIQKDVPEWAILAFNHLSNEVTT